MSDKKATIILIFLCLSFSSFLLGYLSIHYRIGASPTSGQLLNRFVQTSSSTEKPKKTLSLTQNPVISFGLRGDTIRYVGEDGRVFETDTNNSEPKILSQIKFSNILGIIWSRDLDGLIYIVNRNDGNKFVFLNLDSGLIKNFDYTVGAMAFSPKGDIIAYVSTVRDTGFIVVQNLKSSDSKNIASLRVKISALGWLDDNTIYFKSSDNDRYAFFLLTLDGHMTKILEDKPNLEELWSENGKQLLFTYTVSGDNKTRILDVVTKEESSLGLDTSINKCAWSSDNRHVFCSAPKDQSGKEDFYEIDTQTKEKRLILALEPYISVGKLAIYELGGYAVIQNMLDHRLYRISLDI